MRPGDLNIDYAYDPAVPGSWDRSVGYGIADDGTVDFPCQAGVRTIVITGLNANGGNVEIGRKTVTVIAGKTVSLTILVRNP